MTVCAVDGRGLGVEGAQYLGIGLPCKSGEITVTSTKGFYQGIVERV